MSKKGYSLDTGTRIETTADGQIKDKVVFLYLQDHHLCMNAKQVKKLIKDLEKTLEQAISEDYI